MADKPTKYYSQLQEHYLAKKLNGTLTPASGASKFSKGDIKIKNASLLVECKTTTTEKTSFSIKKEWLEKIKEEAKIQQLENSVLAFSFTPEGTENYFVISEKLMCYLINKLEEDIL